MKMSDRLQKYDSTTYDINGLPLTTDGREVFAQQVQSDPELAILLMSEAISLCINGEPDVARIMLRDLVNATIGFEELAQRTGKPSKSLHRMLSARGNPAMDNLIAIIGVLRTHLKVKEFSVMPTVSEAIREPASASL